jgi:DNA-binding SARP family transcriptional activator
VSLAPERVTTVTELDPSLLRVLAMRAERVDAAGDRLAARIHTGAQDEARPPVLVVCAVPPPHASAEQLRCLLPAASRGAVTVVAPAPWPGARTTWCLGEPLPAPRNGGAPVPCKVDRERLRSLAELLQLGRQTPAAQARQVAEAAAHALAFAPPMEQSPQADMLPDVRSLRPTSGIPADNDDGAGLTVEEPRDELDKAVEAYLTNAAPATVSILGPVTVHATGNIDPDRRSRLTELVAYLATHRRGVPVADFDAALWPERQVTLKTRNQAITRTRAWLGSDDEGISWLRPMADGTLRLSRRVLVDWELFKALEQRGGDRRRSADARRHDLETALRLVRGRPLSPLPAGRYGWLAETYLEQEIPSAVIDVAHALARLLLEAGEADRAVDVAQLALEVDRYDERPWRDLLEAHHRLGQDRQVALLVARLRELLEVELDDDFQPETAELIERLLPRRRRA